MPHIDEVADELYRLPLEDFTAARTRYEKAAKAAGNRDEAALIHSLTKPNMTAWLANQLARDHRDELAALLELGARLRAATNNRDGDQLRTLSRQQRELVSALVQHARALAGAVGRSLSEDNARALDDTLRAAVADQQAAGLLLAGRLTDALHSSDFDSGFGSGFGSTVALADVIPLHPGGKGGGIVASRSKNPERPPRDEQRQIAEHALAEAGRAVAAATLALDEARARAADADKAATSAHERVEELRRQLAEASTAASDADRVSKEQAAALQPAERAVRVAERKKQDAQDRRDSIAKDD